MCDWSPRKKGEEAEAILRRYWQSFPKPIKDIKSEIQGALLISSRINTKKPYLSNYTKSTESQGQRKSYQREHFLQMTNNKTSRNDLSGKDGLRKHWNGICKVHRKITACVELCIQQKFPSKIKIKTFLVNQTLSRPTLKGVF